MSFFSPHRLRKFDPVPRTFYNSLGCAYSPSSLLHRMHALAEPDCEEARLGMPEANWREGMSLVYQDVGLEKNFLLMVRPLFSLSVCK